MDSNSIIYYDRASNPNLLKLTNVYLSSSFIFDRVLPSNILSIVFDSYFDKPIPDGFLPKSLKFLDLGWYFRQELTNENIPETVETIKVGYWYNKKPKFNRRNLKLFQVNPTYKIIVDDELLPIMSPEYLKELDKNRKFTPDFHQQCRILDKYIPSFETIEDFKLKTNNEIENWINNLSVRALWSKMFYLSEEKKTFKLKLPDFISNELYDKYSKSFMVDFDTYDELIKWEEENSLSITPKEVWWELSGYILSELEFIITEKQQLIISIKFQTQWRYYTIDFIGHNNNYYKVYMYECSPYTSPIFSNVFDEINGPFTITESIDFIRKNTG